MPRPPIILIGMHRSGTSMLSEFLQNIGLFLGENQNENHEAEFFVNLNDWMLRQGNASWDNPHNFNFTNEYFLCHMKRVADARLSGSARREFLGWGKSFRYSKIQDIAIPWGWKDPRNTFTLDIWKSIFPQAPILHIYRNPIDVAASLRVRDIKHMESFQPAFKAKIKERLAKGKVGYVISLRVQDLEEGVKLWLQYVEKAFSYDANYGPDIIHVKYEDFLQEPRSVLIKVLKMTGLKSDTEHLDRIAAKANPDRSYSFVSDPELIRVYRKFQSHPLLQRLGYDKIV